MLLSDIKGSLRDGWILLVNAWILSLYIFFVVDGTIVHSSLAS